MSSSAPLLPLDLGTAVKLCIVHLVTAVKCVQRAWQLECHRRVLGAAAWVSECMRVPTQVLLAAGASLMVRTVDLDMVTPMQFPAGSTPLHLAAQGGHIAILQAMLQVTQQAHHCTAVMTFRTT